MKNRIVIPVALVCAAAALAITGCGGDDDTSTTTATSEAGASGVGGPALSKEEFIAQADAICKSGSETNDAAAQALGQNPSQDQVTQAVTDTVIPTLRTEIEGIGALTPPEGDEDEVQAILDAASAAIDEVEADPTLILGSSNARPFAEADQLAEDYGLKVCGQG